MKFRWMLTLLAACLCAQETLTNDAVLRLVKAGLGEDIIVSTINQQRGRYSLTVDDLIALKSAGASDRIIAAMSNRSVQPAPAHTTATSTLEALALHDGTPVRLRLGRNLSSGEARVGETVDFEVLEDVKADEVVLAARGGTAIATVTQAQAKGRMARGGKLDINIDYLRLVNGDKVALRAVKETKGGGHTGGMTAGIVVTSLVVWPAAPFFLFMHGKDSVIPKGTEITAYVNGEIKLDRSRFQPSALQAQTQGYEGKPTGAASPSMPPLKASVPVIPASEIRYENNPASPSPRRQQPTSDNTLVNVTFASIPAGALVFLQDALIGRAPTAAMIQPGPYEVKMSADGYADWVGTLTVEAGKPFSLAAQLHPR